jgi:PleD family two-component response regulator
MKHEWVSMYYFRPPSTVLFVDGNKVNRHYWRQRLYISSPDYFILEADSGAEGLAICKSQRVDCVVTEHNLPDMSGFELLVKLVPRARRPEIAVILLSHVTLSSMVAFALKNGAQDFLMKSRISGDDLDNSIQRAIAVVGSSRKEPPLCA